MTQISTIVPVFKAESFLCRCVDSILSQTFEDFELLLVDDGSSDNCGYICDEFSVRDERLLVIHQKNEGVSSARNKGIDYAKGQYVVFVDADDKLKKEALMIFFNSMKMYKTDLVVGGHTGEVTNYSTQEINTRYQYYRDFIILKKPENATIIEKIWAQNRMFSAHGKIYKLFVINDNRIRFNTNLVNLEDADFVINYIKACSSICSIKENVYCKCDYVGRNSWQHRSRTDYVDDVRYKSQDIPVLVL